MYILFRCQHTLVDAAFYWQLTQFHATFCTTVTHSVCYIKMNLDTEDKIYEYICNTIAFI
jgi:hypothetical protein